MKPLLLISFTFVCYCGTANAQLIDHLENQVNGVARELDQVNHDIQDHVRKTIEDELYAQQIINNPVVNPLTDVLAQTTDKIGNTVAALPILNRKGSRVFTEVSVENNWRAIEREWVILIDQSELKALASLDAEIIEQKNFSNLGLQLVRFRVPATLDSPVALKKYLPEHLYKQLDRNHIYNSQISNTKSINTKISTSQTSAVSNPFCTHPVTIGMIDTAINTAHSAFAQSHITTKNFISDDFDAPRAHGTAVAGVLVGKSDQLTPLLPAASLFSASVFYPRNEYAQGATLINLVDALNWLVEEKVRVINMSLTGPDNKILAMAIKKTIQTGTIIVAAAGNEGPAAAPAYPAAYENVIAVTAVDKKQKIYRWANRGDYIDFSALGVSVLTARSDGSFGYETGTSMAAPLVTAAVACVDFSKAIDSSLMFDQLKTQVIDLGASGRDPIFGEGLLNRP